MSKFAWSGDSEVLAMEADSPSDSISASWSVGLRRDFSGRGICEQNPKLLSGRQMLENLICLVLVSITLKNSLP